PVSLARECREYAYFIRRASNTVRASTSELNELFSLAAQIPFDDRMNQRAQVDDIKVELVKAHLMQANSALAGEVDGLGFLDLCWKLNIVGGPPEACYPLNVGLMFFNPRPEAFFPQTQIDIVSFPD